MGDMKKPKMRCQKGGRIPQKYVWPWGTQVKGMKDGPRNRRKERRIRKTPHELVETRLQETRLESKAPQRGVDLTDPSCQKLGEGAETLAEPSSCEEREYSM